MLLKSYSCKNHDFKTKFLLLFLICLRNLKGRKTMLKKVARKELMTSCCNTTGWTATIGFPGVYRIFIELRTAFSRGTFFKDSLKNNIKIWQKIYIRLWYMLKDNLFTITTKWKTKHKSSNKLVQYRHTFKIQMFVKLIWNAFILVKIKSHWQYMYLA